MPSSLVAPSSPAVASQSRTNSFLNLMAEMRDHHKAGSPLPFNLLGSTHFMAMVAMPADPGDSQKTEVMSQMQSIKDIFKIDCADYSNTAQNNAHDAATNLQNKCSSADDFKARMNQQRDATKAANDAAIDKAYDAASNLGANASPATQNAILSTMTTLSNVGAQLITKLCDALTSIMNQVVQLLQGLVSAAESVGTAFAPVAGVLAFL